MMLIVCNAAYGQYYIKGDIKDENGNGLQNVKIYLPSSKMIFYSGATGGFGIPSANKMDSLIFSKENFLSLSLAVNTSVYQNVVLKMNDAAANLARPKLISLTEGIEGPKASLVLYKGESYTNLVENDFVHTDKNYRTTFSMRIDKASYSNIRRFLNQSTKVPPEAVRVEEMLNYFNLNYKEPGKGKVFNIESQLTDCPWDKDHQLLLLNLSAKKLILDSVPPSNFIFLIDVSGSMDMPSRLPLLKESFQLLVKNMRAQDQVSIIVYGGRVGVWLEATSGAEKDKIIESIERLTAAGDTPGEEALRTAYAVARKTFLKDGNNRIILATDGDFNVGQRSEKDLEDLIASEKKSGIYLTCLGVGMGNYKDSKIEILAKKGNGNFAYIDNIHEAEKVLVTEFTQTAFSVASDVRLSIKFDSDMVSSYRLIGYANKSTSLEQKATELEGGEIGSGSGNMVVFEIVPSENAPKMAASTRLATASILYRLPEDTTQQTIRTQSINNYLPFGQINKSLQFGIAVTMFGLKLHESKYFPAVSWDFIKKTAAASIDDKDFLRSQFIDLLDKSKEIYDGKHKNKKKKRRLWF